MKICEYYDFRSKTYDSDRIKGYHYFISRDKIKILKNYAKKDFKTLEVGCGTGVNLESIKNSGIGYGIDISDCMLKIAKAKKLKVGKASATQIPFKDESFDLVFSFQVLPHVEDIQKAINEMYRVCTKRGTIIIDLYNYSSIKHLNGIIVEDILNKKKTYVKYLTYKQMTDLLPLNTKIKKVYSLRLIGFAGFLYKIPIISNIMHKLDLFLCRIPILNKLSSYKVFIIEKI